MLLTNKGEQEIEWYFYIFFNISGNYVVNKDIVKRNAKFSAQKFSVPKGGENASYISPAL